MTARTGILLINLGTPESTGYLPMRRFLKEFLTDPRVVERKGLAWWLALNGIILRKRPRSSGQAYDAIWNRERDESPLKTITRAQSQALATLFPDGRIEVDWAMRYGQPAISQAIARLTAKGCERILFFPLYPQYSAATTATAMDVVFDTLKTMRAQPAIRSVPPYFDHPAYINALAASIGSRHQDLDWQPDCIIASFHGLPQAFIDKGDPYAEQCERTVRLLRDALNLGPGDLRLTWQSRSGREVWLQPDTEETLAELARNGTRNISVITPGFAADCVETLEEIAIRAAQAFRENGGVNFTFVPCLNASHASIEMLHTLASNELSGW